jgi:hypothetical protein
MPKGFNLRCGAGGTAPHIGYKEKGGALTAGQALAPEDGSPSGFDNI